MATSDLERARRALERVTAADAEKKAAEATRATAKLNAQKLVAVIEQKY